nr:GTP-binding protein [Leptolyngbya sp. KIOST-1]
MVSHEGDSLVQGKPRPPLFPAHRQAVSAEDDQWTGPPGNQLVCIGRNLDRKAMEEKLRDCIAEGD